MIDPNKVHPEDAERCPCPECGEYKLRAFKAINQPYPVRWVCQICGGSFDLNQVDERCDELC